MIDAIAWMVFTGLLIYAGYEACREPKRGDRRD